MAIFHAILAGGTLRDRLVASAGGVIGIGLTGALALALLHPVGLSPWLVAPMGAAAVLVFAVPASPLAQPWPVIGGNTISAFVGVTAAKLIPDVALAAGVAVGGAILIMSLCRCLHPPGGAAALTAVVGGPVVLSTGYWFAVVPVGLNAVLLTLAAVAFHRFSGHSYPHRPPAVVQHGAPDREDVDRALEDLSETYDIDREDLTFLVQRAVHHAAVRRAAPQQRRTR
ncbi:HPP family protein [Sphingomonas sp. ABOLG]|jgi:CBS domain-containing membrane protein|uniref:HPP family protein n=1 Tax=Sphingomonas TaxID=13687 RepID=UPI0006216F26|nr:MULTISPECIES: HPP family protein [unclassified Sphingomonas]KKI20123.1 membrane protein [Sphingomonas sp. Ag1]RSV18503.1 HPP family protein [Sphingomonas sp. ABOLG]